MTCPQGWFLNRISPLLPSLLMKWAVRLLSLLLNRLQAENPEPFQEIILPIELIVRRSSGTAEQLIHSP